MMKIAPRPSLNEQIESFTLHIAHLKHVEAKSRGEVERIQRKLITMPGDPVYVKMLDEAEHWLRRDAGYVRSHQKVLDGLLAERG